ncbi:MAG: cyclic-di-AMP receptor [Oscillospiraceae bacterium]|nr:cyclic-di-AMP receptor [Oscillospiraceae bacterium]
MKLLVAIIHRDDGTVVLDELAARGIAFTRLSTTGGFLRTGNDTLLMGLEESGIEGVLDILRAHCSVRKQFVDAGTMPFMGTLLHAPVEVTVGGATVFVLDVDQFHKI